MKDLGFNEYGESSQGATDEESLKKPRGQVEMAQVMPEQDKEGDEEAEKTEISI